MDYLLNMRKLFVSCILVLFAFNLNSQDEYEWWNIKHNWDGVSSWMKYIIYSPSYMGPNSLPVPEVNKAEFDKNYYFNLGSIYHRSEGDKTFNFTTQINLPVAKDRMGILINYMPVEFYRTDTMTRDIRRARDYEPDGYSLGDFYFTTFLQIIKDHPKLPDVLFSINLKTASGTNLRNARNTDAPGYYFDISFGKDFTLSGENFKWIRPYAMLGFYCYQTNWYKYPQNDAFLYGSGLEYGFKKFKITTEIGGYIGYFDLDDKPMVFRTEIKSITNAITDYKLFFQTGLNDFPYTSFGISAYINLFSRKTGSRE